MHNIRIPHKNKFLSLFHINACSLNKNFHDLQHLLSCTKRFFDIIAISETTVTKQVPLLSNLNLNICLFKLLQLKLLQIVPFSTLLIIYQIKRMNWNLLSLKLSTRKNQILQWKSFKDIHQWILLALIPITEISTEQKFIFLRGDFHVKLLNYNEQNQIMDLQILSKIISIHGAFCICF